jgi:transcriptional regulator with XRE-family HTH domain
MSSNTNPAFGPTLRAHRERRGITLAALAESIKTKQSLLDQLERNDVSRWPPGIYGRALVREYAKSIGLPAEEIVQQFVQLSSAPDERCEMALSGRQGEGDETSTADLQLTFAGAPTQALRSISARLAAAAVELAFVVTTGLLVTFVSGLPLWTAVAIVALTWYPARAVFWGHDALYRILRLRRLSTSSLWSQTTEISPFATNLMSMGKTVMEAGLDSADDSFIVKADVNAGSPSSASIH